MNPFKRRVLSGRPDTATWIPGGTPTFRAWEWEKVTGGRDTREMGGGAAGYLVLPLPCVSISNMSNFITGSLAVIRLSNGYINNAGRSLWLSLFSFWRQVTNIISYKSIICTHPPPWILSDGFFCPRERTFLLHKALVYATREQERQSFATEDVMQRFIPTIGFISWFHWLEKGKRGGTYHWSQLVTMKTSTLTAFTGTWLHTSARVGNWFWKMLAVFCVM